MRSFGITLMSSAQTSASLGFADKSRVSQFLKPFLLNKNPLYSQGLKLQEDPFFISKKKYGNVFLT
jgi:hypothetical protein